MTIQERKDYDRKYKMKKRRENGSVPRAEWLEISKTKFKGSGNPMYGKEVSNETRVRISKANSRGEKIIYACDNCKNIFADDKERLKLNHSFCSKKCFHNYFSGDKHPNYSPNSEHYYPKEFNNKFKKMIRLRDGSKCQECGMGQEFLKKTLHVHHIDYDKTNINPINLISLCHRCHMKTNFKRENWKTYFLKKAN